MRSMVIVTHSSYGRCWTGGGCVFIYLKPATPAVGDNHVMVVCKLYVVRTLEIADYVHHVPVVGVEYNFVSSPVCDGYQMAA